MPAAALPAGSPTRVDLVEQSGSVDPQPATPSRGCSLAQVFARVQDGDAGAFAELHARTHHRLRRAVHPVVSFKDLAEDVLQDTYLHIWLKRREYRPERGSVLGWMTIIARRRAIDRVRALPRAETAQTRYTNDPTWSAVTDHQAAVIDAMHATTSVRRALKMLTKTQREALQLTYWDGRTAAQAAQLLGIPVPTLKSRIQSAITRLRNLLNPHQPAHAARVASFSASKVPSSEARHPQQCEPGGDERHSGCRCPVEGFVGDRVDVLVRG